jgi:hypothetical protein
MLDRTEIIPVRFEDGTVIQIQATMLGGMEMVAAKTENFNFSSVTKPIRKIAGEIAKIIKDVQPDKAIVSLGFEVATSEGQLTALLVKGTANASLAVTLEWVKEKESKNAGKSKSTPKR